MGLLPLESKRQQTPNEPEGSTEPEGSRDGRTPIPKCPDCQHILVQHCLMDGNFTCDWWKCLYGGGFGIPGERWVHDVLVGEPV